MDGDRQEISGRAHSCPTRRSSGLGWWGGAGARDAGQWQAWMLGWLWPAGQASHAGPERPLRAMRTILGTPFAPLTRGQTATQLGFGVLAMAALVLMATTDLDRRSEEHTSELQSLMRISHAVFCLKKKNHPT